MPRTDEQLRADLDQALNAARPKWSAWIGTLTHAYSDASDNVSKTLDYMKLQTEPSALDQMFQTIILPAMAGGFVGGIVAGLGKKIIEDIASNSSKLAANVGLDTIKTVQSDLYKADVRLAYQKLNTATGWKPTAVSVARFYADLQLSLDLFLASAYDALNNSKTKTGLFGSYKYRDVIVALYNSPFVWDAPVIERMPQPSRLLPVMETFLWVDWARHRDEKYWSKRIYEVSSTDLRMPSNSTESLSIFETPEDKLKKYSGEIANLNAIYNRISFYGVPDSYITELNQFTGQKFFNILWLRFIGKYYKGTLLGNLLMRLDQKTIDYFPFNNQPGTYRLM